MEEIKPQAISRYTSIIAAIANEAIKKIPNVSKEDGVVKNRLGISFLKNTNCHVYIDDSGLVSIDICVNVDFGASIPEVVCDLQDTIKNDVESATKFTVKRINVNVANVNI
ncbi:MAG: Asp23/Gls24 family envelope stress response protein [Clostridia bacterium]|nr:Asp23/Gls24 family envelope stress response protein [Clostridia bacterium]